ncbi:MAG: hypothetical protein IJW76_07075 [Clostridia bacterium]|nr:hypothetical protein [Clostridia bacterium]
MAKKVLEYIAKIFVYFLLGALVAPFVSIGDPISAYSDPEHWLVCFIIALIVATIEFLIRLKKQ